MESYKSFLERVPVFDDFLNIANSNYFVAVPSDWALILTDVKGSTKAVQAGRYQDVNMVGAASITALLNEFNNRNLPFVFGGDGATLLVPPELKKDAAAVLRRVQRWAQKEFGFELRGHYFELAEIYSSGQQLLIGKYQLSKGNEIYQFRGGALSVADERMKSLNGGMEVRPARLEKQPNLTGLSCRWLPLKTQRGTVLTVLAKATGPKEAQFSEYGLALATIREILGGDFRNACPTQEGALSVTWPPKTLFAEAKALPGFYPLRVGRTLLRTLFSFALFRFNISVGGFSPGRYRSEMISNSDFQKFDDILRMVLDCSNTQADKIEKFLLEREQAGALKFGVHRSSEALMTCLVHSASQNQHLHFIDGAHGGYTLAAVQLKRKATS
ncbi:DUF3095 domain-containing protein [Bdellovibrio sp. 22V]|uniref:DUF3095 domain-containing protein n=1 Tax=Bdellovibrio sp. 22V TaxID=3044166 RepID=UPI00254367FD|nr:DUF3095 domain-containing protein [Bdellovibrio sp. 22V]WII72994.1 DUF3095 domain-containing protein [Bdellovibrio sp. 22V]